MFSIFTRLPFGSATTFRPRMQNPPPPFLRTYIHTYPTKPTSDLSTATSVFVFVATRCAAIASLQSDSFFFSQQARHSVDANPIPYNPTDKIAHPRYIHIAHIPYPSSTLLKRPHLTKVSNIPSVVIVLTAFIGILTVVVFWGGGDGSWDEPISRAKGR